MSRIRWIELYFGIIFLGELDSLYASLFFLCRLMQQDTMHLGRNNTVGHYYIQLRVRSALLYFLHSTAEKCIPQGRKEDAWQAVARMIEEERSQELFVERLRKCSEVTPAKSEYSRRRSSKLRSPSCECCGKPIHSGRGKNAVSNPPHKKFCSSACQDRAARRRQSAMLGSPASKRYVARLKFSSPLYFN